MQTPVFDGVMFDHSNQFEQDNKLYVQFFKTAVQNNFKSEQQGRAIFDEVNMVRIMTPGSRDIMVGKATAQYQARFPKQWASFLQGQEQAIEGTPLEEVPFLSVGQVAELKAINVKTLEQLAHMSDVHAQQFMGNFALRQKAQAFLQAAKDAAPNLKMQEELAQRDAEIKELKETVSLMQQYLKSQQAEKKVAEVAPPTQPQAQKVSALPMPTN